MQRDPKAYLWDARQALDAITAFMHGRTREEFLQDLMLRSAISWYMATP
jgi:uncharacterized protein with HEPN domain